MPDSSVKHGAPPVLYSANVRVVMVVLALLAQGFAKPLLKIATEIESGAEFGQLSDSNERAQQGA